eukprot:CAMPEP_0206436976 /NCGR_PEP_ID=MMETSP0324_2-20121206/10782_1 /ASSEMBLY_ACC=CAM_ASM_000836 /TAXON_ID=2866 /ORGANISM="Crypthecodinium cohnii, Strain Seligo" /LENGTH=54 /DNA_ID=CAMNT_0053904201 /DNA_START=95 /DNA_END=256 /DNA_ORIENTATION=+
MASGPEGDTIVLLPSSMPRFSPAVCHTSGPYPAPFVHTETLVASELVEEQRQQT